MKIGIVKETKNKEFRVAASPDLVKQLVEAGHEVIVETQAGEGSRFSNASYEKVGATIGSTEEAWDVEMVMKVKEPQPEEYKYFKEGLIIFAYFHLAAEPELTKALVDSGATAVAYESIKANDGSLPALTPMSQVAGRMSIQVGMHFLERNFGGKGLLLGGVPGTDPGQVTIIGGGVVGENAAAKADALGANVTILDVNKDRLDQLKERYPNFEVAESTPENIDTYVKKADIVIGAVLIPGSKAPVLVKNETVKQMEQGSVIVDIAVDQGGIFESNDRATSHDEPIVEKFGVLHYAVPNMPGAVPRTSSLALENVTGPFALEIAEVGLEQAAINDPMIESGIDIVKGQLTNEAAADSLGLTYVPYKEAEH